MNGVPNPNFKGFMADNNQANWNTMQIMYGSGGPSESMVDREQTYYFHCVRSMDRHTKQQIKPKMCEQHTTLCYEYKNATFLEEIDICFVVIRCWWSSSKVADVLGLQELENRFNFWHFHVKQWGGFIIDVTISSFFHNFHPILFGWHVYNMLRLI